MAHYEYEDEDKLVELMMIDCACGCGRGFEGEVSGHVDPCGCEKCHYHYGKL